MANLKDDELSKFNRINQSDFCVRATTNVNDFLRLRRAKNRYIHAVLHPLNRHNDPSHGSSVVDTPLPWEGVGFRNPLGRFFTAKTNTWYRLQSAAFIPMTIDLLVAYHHYQSGSIRDFVIKETRLLIIDLEISFWHSSGVNSLKLTGCFNH